MMQFRKMIGGVGNDDPNNAWKQYLQLGNQTLHLEFIDFMKAQLLINSRC